MGQVIELRRTRELPASAPGVLFCCARCGADLWNLLADGRVRCADCEEECPMRTVQKSGTQTARAAREQEYEMNKGE